MGSALTARDFRFDAEELKLRENGTNLHIRKGFVLDFLGIKICCKQSLRELQSCCRVFSPVTLIACCFTFDFMRMAVNRWHVLLCLCPTSKPRWPHTIMRGLFSRLIEPSCRQSIRFVPIKAIYLLRLNSLAPSFPICQVWTQFVLSFRFFWSYCASWNLC